MEPLSPISTNTSTNANSNTPPSSVPSPASAGPDAPFRIAIIGGGIGGLTAALFLNEFCTSPSHRRIEVSIYEQAQEYREIGAGIGLGANATKLFARILDEYGESSLLESINAISGSRNGVWFIFRRFDTGEEIVTIPRNEPEDSKIRFVAVSRAEVHAVLLKFVQDNHDMEGRLFVGKKLQSIVEDDSDPAAPTHPEQETNQTARPVKINFEDGTTAAADLVIAADGIRSAARQQFIRDNAVYGRKVLYRGLVPMSELPSPWPLSSHVAMWNAVGKHFVIYPISADKTLNIIGCTDKDESEIPDLQESWVSTCDKSEIEDDFKEFQDPLVKEVIRLMPDLISKWRINDRKPAEEWVFLDGRVVLLGDAAHPMVPHQSAGAGQAVEDGYILAKALSEYLATSPPASMVDSAIHIAADKNLSAETKTNNLKKWMDLYQHVRMPRAARTQESSRKAGDLFEMMSSEMEGKSYDERLPILIEGAKNNMKWIWTEDIDAAYEKHRGDM